MAKPKSLPDHLLAIWEETEAQLEEDAPASVIESVCRQIWLMRDAERRIQEEGAVVVDAKGNASEHPAIRIQRDAQKEIRTWMDKYRRVKKGW